MRHDEGLPHHYTPGGKGLYLGEVSVLIYLEYVRQETRRKLTELSVVEGNPTPNARQFL